MTNGEKLKEIFPDIEFTEMAYTVHAVAGVTSNGVKGHISYDFWKEWWNAEYKEPTTKNDKVDCKHTDCNNCVNHKYCDYESNKSEIPTSSVDCVSRQAVEQLVYEFLQKGTDENIAFYEHFLDLPSVAPIRPKGHWIDKFGGVYRCSCCREIISIDTIEFPYGITYKYCPYCGSNNSVEIEKEE